MSSLRLHSMSRASSQRSPRRASILKTGCLPTAASSAILVAFAWAEDLHAPSRFHLASAFLCRKTSARAEQLLACTFVDQKFPHRAPEGARVMRAFFGGESAESLSSRSDEEIAELALTQLRNILGPIPEPSFHTVRRWPRSLPQYEVGHLDRIAELEATGRADSWSAPAREQLPRVSGFRTSSATPGPPREQSQTTESGSSPARNLKNLSQKTCILLSFELSKIYLTMYRKRRRFEYVLQIYAFSRRKRPR